MSKIITVKFLLILRSILLGINCILIGVSIHLQTIENTIIGVMIVCLLSRIILLNLTPWLVKKEG